MLTDDQITSRLRSSFDQATTDLHYTRRVTPPRRRTALFLAPAASLVGAAAVGAVVLGQPAAAPRPTSPTVAAPTPRTTPSPRTVTAHLRLAGYVMTYRRRAGAAADDAMSRLVEPPAPVPAGARKVTNSSGIDGFIAVYPGTHDEALWARLPKVTGTPKLVAMVSQGLTADQLADMWSHSTPEQDDTPGG